MFVSVKQPSDTLVMVKNLVAPLNPQIVLDYFRREFCPDVQTMKITHFDQPYLLLEFPPNSEWPKRLIDDGPLMICPARPFSEGGPIDHGFMTIYPADMCTSIMIDYALCGSMDPIQDAFEVLQNSSLGSLSPNSFLVTSNPFDTTSKAAFVNTHFYVLFTDRDSTLKGRDILKDHRYFSSAGCVKYAQFDQLIQTNLFLKFQQYDWINNLSDDYFRIAFNVLIRRCSEEIEKFLDSIDIGDTDLQTHSGVRVERLEFRLREKRLNGMGMAALEETPRSEKTIRFLLKQTTAIRTIPVSLPALPFAEKGSHPDIMLTLKEYHKISQPKTKTPKVNRQHKQGASIQTFQPSQQYQMLSHSSPIIFDRNTLPQQLSASAQPFVPSFSFPKPSRILSSSDTLLFTPQNQLPMPPVTHIPPIHPMTMHEDSYLTGENVERLNEGSIEPIMDSVFPRETSPPIDPLTSADFSNLCLP
ncbi:hypothetical protein BLNAU_10273 [Blattamonas nauphoetae]|uniref:Uncharacterized protein n=1 Tax=Blattamonas nauphoetae TaxID=2049346 RepID=A0ABQ9XTH4_9EUKA|nr:hypothetical protein BLNAU_10273 [Blattamonas nauphoetae]